jgi:hypothetical protein
MYDAENYDDALLDAVLSMFEVLRPPFAREVPMTTIIITLPLIDLGAVSWIWIRREIDIVTAFLDLVGWLPTEQVGTVLPLIVSIFLRQDINEIYDIYANPSTEGSLATLLSATQIGFLMDEAEKKGNDSVWNWLREEFAKNAPLVKAGPWVMDQGERPKKVLDLPRAYIVGDPLRPSFVQEQHKTFGESAEKIVGILMCDAGVSTATTKREVYGIIDDRYKDEEEEKELFRQYGPSNPFFTDKADDEDIPAGSDRMFTCDVFNYDEDDEAEPIYTGSCDWRGHKIDGERAAVRRPVPGGGWMGSYCSTYCIREQLEDGRGIIANVDGILAAVDSMEKQLVEWKVYEKLT